MKSTDITINFEGPVYRNYVNSATIQFYNYPATISDGTIFGTPTVSSDGTTLVVGELQPNMTGNYEFKNVYSGIYTVIASGPGITTHIVEGMDKYEIPLLYNTTGSDLMYKDDSTTSIADRIDESEAQLSNNITLNGKGNYSTIQDAITESASGDFVYVRRGNYTENLVIGEDIHLHIEEGTVVTSPTDAITLYGANLSNFKLTGGARFVNNGIQPAVYVSGKSADFPNLDLTQYVELNSGKQLIYSNNYTIDDEHPYYYSEDGINYSRATDYSIPYGLKTISKDGTNKIFGYTTYIITDDYTLIVGDNDNWASTYQYVNDTLIIPNGKFKNGDEILANGTYSLPNNTFFIYDWYLGAEIYPISVKVEDTVITFTLPDDTYDGNDITDGELDCYIYVDVSPNPKGFYYSIDNGLNWTLNNNGITASASDTKTGFYDSTSETVFLAVGTSFYKSTNNGTSTWQEVNAGLPSAQIIKALLIGNYGYVLVNNKIYRTNIRISPIAWTLFDVETASDTINNVLTENSEILITEDSIKLQTESSISTSSITKLTSNGTDTLYLWNNTEKKLYKCKVTETSTWSEIIFPLDLLTNSVTLSYIEWYNSYLYCSFDKIGVFRYYDGRNWHSITEGLESSSLSISTPIMKINNFLYTPNQYLIRYFNGSQWIKINGGSNIHLEFNGAYNWGYRDNPNSNSPAFSITNSNLNLTCKEIYSKRNVGLNLNSLYGNIYAKIGKIETGVPNMPDGEAGSTAILTNCDGYLECNEIIVNNVGHAISPRNGIMYFKIQKMVVNNNHPLYHVQTISQITSQATIGITTTIEFDEMYNMRGKYQGSCNVIQYIGTLNLKGRKMINETDSNISSTGFLNVQVDSIENIGNWTALQVGGKFPNTVNIKNSSLKSAFTRVALFNYDTYSGASTKSITFENCSFESASSADDYIMQAINYGVTGWTPVAMNVILKGINTFSHIPNNLITFTGNGSIYINGQPIIFGKYFYLVGNETTNGSWRVSATLGGNLIYETRINGTWTTKQTIN